MYRENGLTRQEMSKLDTDVLVKELCACLVCPNCDGTGSESENDCPDCHGMPVLESCNRCIILIERDYDND